MHLDTRTLLSLALAAALAASAGPAAAQEAGAPGAAVRAPAVSPLLPPGHWAVEAAQRAEAMGLVTGWLPAQRAAPRAYVGDALRAAARAARASGDAGVQALAEGWVRRFVEEFPETAAAPEAAVRRLGSEARVGWADDEGRLSPARGSFDRRVDPRPLPDRSDVVAGLGLAAGVGRFASLQAEVVSRGDDVRLGRWDARAGWRGWALSVGRMPVGYGVSRGGAVALTGADLERVELRTERPLRLPGLLRHLGPVSAHAAVSRFTEAEHRGDPYFWAMRAAVQPHPRFTVGVNRAAVFGGDSVATDVSLESLAKMFVGVLSDDFENQVVSVDGRFRLPTERVLPLTLYLEWGSEDGAGGWWDVPGIVGGAVVPAVPGAPALSLGAEYAHFAPLCCYNPPWYFHGTHLGGWVLDDRPLGHPLGGEGREASAYASAALLRARLRLDGRVFVRDRGDEGLVQWHQRAGNLFAPDRTGESRGFSLEAAWRVLPRADVRASWFRDAGEEWTEQRAAFDFLYYF